VTVKHKHKQMQDNLFDAWDEMRVQVEAEQKHWSAYTKALQEAFNVRQKEQAERMQRWGDLLNKIERKKLNLEAMVRGRKAPFPVVKDGSLAVLAEAKKAISEIKAVQSMRDDESPGAVLEAAEDAAEEYMDGEEQPSEQPEKPAVDAQEPDADADLLEDDDAGSSSPT
jgi:hypothetical protein